MIKLKNR